MLKSHCHYLVVSIVFGAKLLDFSGSDFRKKFQQIDFNRELHEYHRIAILRCCEVVMYQADQL
jgi:hypothetical protein